MNWSNFTSLLWIIGIGAAFYLMMKMHGNHSHGESQQGPHQHGAGGDGLGHGAGQEKPIDPVCGMSIDPERAAAMRTVGGRNFFLCSASCLEKFDKEPERYAAQARGTIPAQTGSHSGHQGHGCC